MPWGSRPFQFISNGTFSPFVRGGGVWFENSTPTLVDVLTFVGSFGLFMTFFLLFCRFLPILAISEIKGVMPQAHLKDVASQGHGDYHGDILTEKGEV